MRVKYLCQRWDNVTTLNIESVFSVRIIYFFIQYVVISFISINNSKMIQYRVYQFNGESRVHHKQYGGEHTFLYKARTTLL